MDKEQIDLKIAEADLACKVQHVELLKAQTRRENAEADRIGKSD